MKKLSRELFEIGAVKFGEFTYKSGISGPIYIDLRILVSHPEILRKVALLMNEKSKEIKFNKLLGIAYTGIPIVTAMSLLSNIPASYTRKEIKGYGIPKLIEGKIKPEDKILIIDDLVTTGGSKIETIEKIKKTGINCKIAGVLVFVDRGQGGKETLEKHGLKLYSVITLLDLIKEIYEQGLINEEKYKEVVNYLKPKPI